MLIGLVELCSDHALAGILETVQNIMQIFQIAVPIISIVALVKLLIQMMADPENKKLTHGFRNWIVLLMTFFLLPAVINAVMGTISYADTSDGTADFTFANCWEYARYGKNPPSNTGVYNPVDDEDNRTKVTD